MPAESLTNDEFAVLMIAAEGESVMSIARWEKPIESLVAKGFLTFHDKFNNTITPAGRQAIEERDRQDDAALRQVIEKGNQMAGTRAELQRSAEDCAQVLVALARTSATITGDSPESAARKWMMTILSRSLELLRDDWGKRGEIAHDG